MRFFLVIMSFFAIPSIYAYDISYQVKPSDIYEGYIVEKIWLNEYATPQVKLSRIYVDAALTKSAHLPKNDKVTVTIGKERKRPFALIRIPAYKKGTEIDHVEQLTSFTLTIDEKAPQPNVASSARKTDVTTSALATGTWYKIGVTKTGFYKIDYNFLSAMGIDPSKVSPADIRVFGNGGNILSENNAVPRKSDLIENAIWVSDNSNSVFNSGNFAVFYAVGPTEWDKDSVNKRFSHKKNIYTDTAYYFITFDQGAGLRIANQTSVPTPNVTVDSFNYYVDHDTDIINPAEMGKIWYGEEFNPLGNTTLDFTFNFPSFVSSLYCTVYFVCLDGSSGSTVSVSLNGGKIMSNSFPATTSDVPIGGYDNGANGICNAQTANISITFTPADASGVGYLNYIVLNARCALDMPGDQMNFRDMSSVGTGKIANFQLQSANGNTQVWDVTNPQVPVKMAGNLSGSTYTFAQDASLLHEYAAMNSTNLYTPSYTGTVQNQNLHGSGQVDCIIVTNSEFLDAANQLADYHRQHDNLRVIVATTDQVYNEFSSGGQDVSAIRDFAKMFYDRAGSDTTQMPRYLTLLGNGSYDYKNRLPNNDDYVPVYESDESFYSLDSYCSDDFFGMLDDNEDIENTSIFNTLDVGVGRLPARSVTDATSLVNKIVNYKSPATLGTWRIASLFVADNDDDAGDHMGNAEEMAGIVTAATGDLFNENKVYIDAIPTITTPAGPRTPGANEAIDGQVYKGTLLINYNGHGNTQVWATERILTQDDYNNWNNVNMLPFMITATCDFGQYDHPQFISAAEQLVLRNGGGVIAALTTTQEVYASYNVLINSQYLESQFLNSHNGIWNTFGDATRIGKNVTYAVINEAGELANFRKFSLLGDPALTPDFPKYNIHIDSILNGAAHQPVDSIKALGTYIISGSVVDYNANLLNDFNGTLFVSIFDKYRTVPTILPTSIEKSFQLQDNIIYKGKATVNNGHFSFSFIAPKDINYNNGHGKISTYADNGTIDAAGVDTDLVIGGFSDNPVISTTPPVVKPYMNDSLFLDGGLTGSNSVLFVSLWAQTGINVTGSEVGHDLTAVLDGNTSQPYVLNDYYQTVPNNYQQGYVSFPVNGLADGAHTITVTAWDVNDNSGQGTVKFVVGDSSVVMIQNLMNYPNPFKDVTHFVFEHNHPDEEINIQINIYNSSGVFVKNINQTFTPAGSRSNEITWDGTDNNGAKLPSGLYVYRLIFTTKTGFKSTTYQKLVIMR